MTQKLASSKNQKKKKLVFNVFLLTKLFFGILITLLIFSHVPPTPVISLSSHISLSCIYAFYLLLS